MCVCEFYPRPFEFCSLSSRLSPSGNTIQVHHTLIFIKNCTQPQYLQTNHTFLYVFLWFLPQALQILRIKHKMDAIFSYTGILYHKCIKDTTYFALSATMCPLHSATFFPGPLHPAHEARDGYIIQLHWEHRVIFASRTQHSLRCQQQCAHFTLQFSSQALHILLMKHEMGAIRLHWASNRTNEYRSGSRGMTAKQQALKTMYGSLVGMTGMPSLGA